MTMSVVTSVNTVGSKKAAALGGPLIASDDLGALLDRIGDVRFDLLDRLHVDQWPDPGTRLEPVGDIHRTCGLGEALGEGVVDAVLHQNPVGADAGLAGIPIFRGDRPFTAISISASSKTMNRRIATQFQRQFLDPAGTLLHQQFADLGRAGEGQFADDRVRGQLGAHQFRQLRDAGESPRPAFRHGFL